VVPVRSRLSGVTDWWSEATWIDYGLAFLIVGAHVLIVEQTGHGDWLRWSDSAQRLTVYGTGAVVISIIGALSTIAVAVYLAAGGERARAVRLHYPSALRRNWRALIIATGLTAGLCLVAQALDTGKDPRSARFVFEFAMVVASLRFIRLVWLFNAMIRIADRDLTDRSRGPAPDLDDSWSRRIRT
jgi:hypothetical protein